MCPGISLNTNASQHGIRCSRERNLLHASEKCKKPQGQALFTMSHHIGIVTCCDSCTTTPGRTQFTFTCCTRGTCGVLRANTKHNPTHPTRPTRGKTRKPNPRPGDATQMHGVDGEHKYPNTKSQKHRGFREGYATHV